MSNPRGVQSAGVKCRTGSRPSAAPRTGSCTPEAVGPEGEHAIMPASARLRLNASERRVDGRVQVPPTGGLRFT